MSKKHSRFGSEGNRLGFEQLESRRLLAVYNPPPLGEEVVFVAPAGAGLAPISIPAGIIPAGTTELPPAPGGQFPAGIPEMSAQSETFATTLAVDWFRANPTAEYTVTSAAGASSFSMTIVANDVDGDFFSYTVTETATSISVAYAMRQGTHAEILASNENPTTLNGGLVYCTFDSDVLTTAGVQSEVAGTSTVWNYPETTLTEAAKGKPAPTQPGLGSRKALSSLDNLVSSHLTTPAKKATMNTFHTALDAYFAELGSGLKQTRREWIRPNTLGFVHDLG